MVSTIKPYAYNNTMAYTRGQHIKFFTPLYSDDNEIIVIGGVVVVVFHFCQFETLTFFFDDHLSITESYHKQITCNQHSSNMVYSELISNRIQ